MNNFNNEIIMIDESLKKDFKLLKVKEQRTKNNLCKKDITECLTTSIKEDTIKYIGGGTYGSIFKSEDLKGRSIIIKMIINVDITGSKKQKLNYKMNKELELTIAMGELGVGPIIYDAIFHEINSDEIDKYKNLSKMLDLIKNGHKNKNDNGSGNKTHAQFKLLESNIDTCNKRKGKKVKNCHLMNIQIISMQGFEKDGNDALFKSNLDNNVKYEIITRFIDLIYKQIFELYVYCYDIKPANFVINTSPVLDVKMIDFGIDFCVSTNIYNEYDNEEVMYENLYPKEILFFSNVIQILLILDHQNFFYEMSQETISRYSMCFFKNKLMSKIINLDWKKLIKQIVFSAYNNNEEKIFDPSNMLIHYSGIGDYYEKSEDKVYETIIGILEKYIY